jgi:hypothetical protein
MIIIRETVFLMILMIASKAAAISLCAPGAMLSRPFGGKERLPGSQRAAGLHVNQHAVSISFTSERTFLGRPSKKP